MTPDLLNVAFVIIMVLLARSSAYWTVAAAIADTPTPDSMIQRVINDVGFTALLVWTTQFLLNWWWLTMFVLFRLLFLCMVDWSRLWDEYYNIKRRAGLENE